VSSIAGCAQPDPTIPSVGTAYSVHFASAAPLTSWSVSILAKTPEQFHGAVSSLYLDVALDGQILHDPRGFAVTRLDALRRSIERLGLRRERIPEGFDWRWEKTPAASWPLSWSADSHAAA
jgi:hypothetical protein